MKRSFLLLASLFAVLAAALANDSTYLNFTAVNGPATIKLTKIGNPDTIHLQYSTDSVTWNTYTIGNTISLASGSKVYFKALSTNSTFSKDYNDNYYQYEMTGTVAADGNIMSLLDATMTQVSVPQSCFFKLFYNCQSLITAPVLPATTVGGYSYVYMFRGCTALTTAPALPATSLGVGCYAGLFRDCTALTTAPALPATSLAISCYSQMFFGCESLAAAPALPASGMLNGCYTNMFSGCTALTTAPALPATTLAQNCYHRMFEGCTSLAEAPALPATSVGDYSYHSMFKGCTSLTKTPALTADTVDFDGCSSMFEGCTSLTQISPLPATIYRDHCYEKMFYGCTSLVVNTQGPGKQWKIPTSYYYYHNSELSNMFDSTGGTMNGTPTENTIYYLPNGTSASFVTVSSNDTAMGSVTGGGLYANGDTVTLIAHPKAGYHFDAWSNGETTDTITLIVRDDTTLTATFSANGTYLNFTAVNGPATIKLDSVGTPYTINLQYSTDSTTWNTYTIGNTINLASGAKVYFKALNTNSVFCKDNKNFYRFVMSGRVSADGNIMSLLDATMTQNSVPSSAFSDLFAYCTSMTQAPALPATGMAYDCYYRMFADCTSLVAAPALPAEKLASGCYSGMFAYCMALTAAPALPATSLARGCYWRMFLGCTSLATPPVLPATTLAHECYYEMFDGCSALTSAPTLPATVLTDSCYKGMFQNCTSLITAPVLPATIMAYSCYSNMFLHCRSLTTAPALPATTLAPHCYYCMFSSCPSLTTAPSALPADSLTTACYAGMFGGCTALTTPPDLPAHTLADYCYSRMFIHCRALDTLPSLPATTLADSCYFEMFDSCVTLRLYSQSPGIQWRIPATITASGALTNMFINTAGTMNGTPSANTTYYLTNRNARYTITANSNDTVMGTVTGGGVYKERVSATLTATAKTHYHFVSWSNGKTTSTITVTAYGDSTLTATFAPDRHNVNVLTNDINMGSVSGTGSYGYGTTATLTATAKTHYHFVSWSNGAIANPLTITIYGDSTLTATFAPDRHNVNVLTNDINMGSVTGTGSYGYGTTATLTATANPHYHFVSWSNGATTNPLTITIYGDSTLTATFAPDPYTVTVLSNDTTMGNVSGGGTFNYGQTITLIATANANYHLVNWSNGATTDTITITLTSDTTLTANFAITQYTVTVVCNDSSMGYVAGGGAFNYGDTATLTATAYANYRFVSWSNGALTDTITVIVKGDTILTANFVVDYGHSVIVNSNDSSADVYFYCQQMYDTVAVREYHLVIYKVGGNDTANVYFSSDTSFVMNRKPRVIVIVDSVTGTTTTVTITINRAAFSSAVNRVAVHLKNLAPNSTYSLYLEALGAMRVVLDHDSCILTTPVFTSVPDVYDGEAVDDFFPTEETDVYTIDGHYIGKYYLELPPGVYLMRDKGRWHKFGKAR